MTDFVATLSAEASGNWAICKAHGLWGSGDNNHAVHASGLVRAGDSIFIWQSGVGFIAAAEAVGPATAVDDRSTVPWPERHRYRHTFPIRILVERDDPIPDSFPSNVSTRFGLKTHQLQSGFTALSSDQASLIADAFGFPSSSAGAEATTSPTPLSAVFVRSSSSMAEVLLTLYRRAMEDDQLSDLLVVGGADDRPSFEAEIAQPPFDSVRDRIRFVTREELAQELQG